MLLQLTTGSSTAPIKPHTGKWAPAGASTSLRRGSKRATRKKPTAQRRLLAGAPPRGGSDFTGGRIQRKRRDNAQEGPPQPPLQSSTRAERGTTKSTPRGVLAEITETTGSMRRKAVSGLTEKGTRKTQERAGCWQRSDRACFSSQTRSMAKWQVKATCSTPRLGPSPPGKDLTRRPRPSARADSTCCTQQILDIEDDVDDPSSSGGVHIPSGNPLGTQAEKTRRKRARQRKKSATTVKKKTPRGVERSQCQRDKYSTKDKESDIPNGH